MPHVNFGTKDTQGFELDVSPDLIAVRTRSLRTVRGVGSVAHPSSAEVSDGNLVASFPEAGVEIYRVPTATRSLDARKRSLRSDADVRFAGSVLVQPKSGKPVLYSENIYIRFKPEIDSDDCEAVLLEVGLTIREHLAFATGAHYCLGAGLARMEAEIAWRVLFGRFPKLRKDGVATYRPTPIMRGLSALPVRLR